jgi:hypothetical protein
VCSCSAPAHATQLLLLLLPVLRWSLLHAERLGKLSFFCLLLCKSALSVCCSWQPSVVWQQGLCYGLRVRLHGTPFRALVIKVTAQGHN